MKKNIDDKNKLEGESDNNLNWLTPDEIAKKFDDQMDKLKKIAKKEAQEEQLENNTDWELDKTIDEFFDKTEDEFNDIDSFEEKKVINNYANISDRNIEVQDAIRTSWNSVLNEIADWKTQKNVVSKTLLRVSNWILSSEKINKIRVKEKK